MNEQHSVVSVGLWAHEPGKPGDTVDKPGALRPVRASVIAGLLGTTVWMMLPTAALAQSCGMQSGVYVCNYSGTSTAYDSQTGSPDALPMQVNTSGDVVMSVQPGQGSGLNFGSYGADGSGGNVYGLQFNNTGSITLNYGSGSNLSPYGLQAVLGGGSGNPGGSSSVWTSSQISGGIAVANSGSITINMGSGTTQGGGILAREYGGAGQGSGAAGGSTFASSITNTGQLNLTATGTTGFAGMQALSLGGYSNGNGGGGNAGSASVISNGAVAVNWTWQNAASTSSGVYGVQALSQGADGVSTNTSSSSGGGGTGGQGRSASVTLHEYGDVAVTVSGTAPQNSPDVPAAVVAAMSLGGDGGSASQGNGNSGAFGGGAQQVSISHADAYITATGDYLPGLVAYGAGGDGGNGGTPNSAGAGGNPSQNGGYGGSTEGASVSVSAQNRNMTIYIGSDGPGQSPAIAGIQVGGDGGYGGFSQDTGFSTSHGGDGGSGGNAGAVSISVTGQNSNVVTVITDSPSSPGVYASSVGGAGNDAGQALTSIGGQAEGGDGGTGGAGGDITVTVSSAQITTNHSNAPGIVARSQGGTGGAGGYANAGTGSAQGGDGGNGGSSGNVQVSLDSASSITTTYGSDAMGILAQSISADGNDSGGTNSCCSGGPGTTGVGGSVGTVTVTNAGTISTAGSTSRGILAQAMAGSGGAGGSSWSIFHSNAGTGGAAGASGAITVTNSGAITTAGDTSQGVLLQSIGGQGGAGGSASGIIANVGGGGGNASAGGDISFTNSGSISTSGSGGIGVLAQSIGGNGGDGGGAAGITVNVGGTGGSSSTTGGTITGNFNSGSKIHTTGDNAHGAVFQSIGGGGGNGGDATGTGVQVTVNVGGSGGSAGGGGAVTVQANNAFISTTGIKSAGLIAQSVGGGGGTGGNAVGTSLGALFDVSVSVGGQGGSAANGGGQAEVTLVGGSIATGQSKSLQHGSSDVPQICARSSSSLRTCNVQPVDGHGVVVQSIGGGGGQGGNSLAHSIADAAPVTPGGTQAAVSAAVSVGGNGGSGGDGGRALFAMSSGADITTLGNGATGVLVQSIGGGGGDGGDSSAMAAAMGYTSGASPTGKVYGVELTSTVAGTGGGAGSGGQVDVVMGGTINSDGGYVPDDSGSSPTSIVTYGDYAVGVKAQSIGGGGGNAGVGSSNTQDFGTKTTSSLTFNVGRAGSPGGDGGPVAVYLYPGKGIQTFGSSAAGVIAQSIGGGGGTSQGGSFSLAQSLAGGSQKPGANVNLGNQTSEKGGTGGTVSVSVQAPIVTRGNDSTGVLAQSIGGGGGLGGTSGSDGSGDNPVVQALQGREFVSDVVNWLNDPTSGAQDDTTLNVSIGGTGGTGGAGGDVTVWLASGISTLGNPVKDQGNQQASTGDWAHGIVAQSIGGGGGKGGTAWATANGGDWAEVNSSYNFAVGGTGGSGGAGGTVTVNLQNNGVIQTVGYGATGIVAQSIGGGGGMGADGSDALGGNLSVGMTKGRDGGAGGAGGSVVINEYGNLGSTIQTQGIFADGINAQSVGGGGGIAGAGSSVWGSYGVPGAHAKAGMTFTAGGGTSSSGGGGSVQINPDFANNPLLVNVSGYGAYGVLAQSIGGGGGNIIANQAGSGTPTIQLGGVGNDAQASGGAVQVNLTSPSVITASGIAGIGVVAQSVGSGGGIIRINDGTNTTPGLTTGYNATFANQTSPGPADGGSVTVSSYATISANGPGGIGIFAQSVGGGGGLILNGSTLYAGAPLQQGIICGASDCGSSTSGSDNFTVTLLSNSVSATGENGVGIFAQAAGYGLIASGTPNVIVGSGDDSNGHTTTVTGGTGNGAAIWIDRPNGPSGLSQAYIKAQLDGVITTAAGSSGTAVKVTGGGSVTLTNLGSITGTLALGPESVQSGSGSFNAGPVNSNGGYDSDRGVMRNQGIWTAGKLAVADIVNEGNIRYDDATMATRVNGHFIQTAKGRLSPLIDSVNGKASLFQVEGSAKLDGAIVPTAVTLLPGEVPVLTAGSLDGMPDAQDSLIYRWDTKRSGNTLSITPTADFT
ncbi:beta strand repeat-containing protein, partial [Bordetella tumulicola]